MFRDPYTGKFTTAAKYERALDRLTRDRGHAFERAETAKRPETRGKWERVFAELTEKARRYPVPMAPGARYVAEARDDRSVYVDDYGEVGAYMGGAESFAEYWDDFDLDDAYDEWEWGADYEEVEGS